jgi:hypothetical protein
MASLQPLQLGHCPTLPSQYACLAIARAVPYRPNDRAAAMYPAVGSR